jgi:hypothetical protein
MLEYVLYYFNFNQRIFSVLGLSRILQIARVAKYRQQFTPNHIETKDLMNRSSQGNIGSNFNQVNLDWMEIAGEFRGNVYWVGMEPAPK